MFSLFKVLGYLVYVALFSYFVSRVATSLVRLQEKQIGTLIEKVNEHTLLYPSVNACQYDKIVHNTNNWFFEKLHGVRDKLN
jgi:hypothetical protein